MPSRNPSPREPRRARSRHRPSSASRPPPSDRRVTPSAPERALRSPELPVEIRHDETDRLRRAGRGRDEVACGSTGTAIVLVRPSRASDRPCRRAPSSSGRAGSRAPRAAPSPRRQAVRRARRVRDDPVRRRVVGLVEVDAEHHRDVGLFAGAEMITLRAPASRCLSASIRARKWPVDSITTSTSRSAQGSFRDRSRPGQRCVDRRRSLRHRPLDRTGEGP